MTKNPEKNPLSILSRMVKDRAFRICLARASHFWFFHFYFAHYVSFETADFQRDIFNLTEKAESGLTVIVSFRGSAKSTICTLSYPLWAILGKERKKFVVILSQTQRQARQHLANIKNELEKNRLLQNDLGPFKEETDEWGGYSLVIPRYDARITAASSEQSIRGIRHLQYRPDVIIADDVEDLDSTKTQEGREKTYNWFKGDALPAGTINTTVIVVGNLLHEDSLLKRLKAEIAAGTLKGVYREYPIHTEEKEIMWPGKFPTFEAIEAARRKLSDEFSWQREMLLKILPSENQIIRKEWIQYYDCLPASSHDTYHAIGIDLAISQKSSADYTAMVPAKIQGNRDRLKVYILPNIINKRLSSQETMDTAKMLSDSLERGHLFIEDNGFQAIIVEHLRRDNYPAKGVRSVTDKHSRLSGISFLLQSGKVLFPRNGAEALIQQLLGFGVEKHDDMVDALSLLLGQVIQKDRRVMPTVIEKPDKL